MQDPDATMAALGATGPEPEPPAAPTDPAPEQVDAPGPDSDACASPVPGEVARPDPADGLRLALLVGIALLLCTCTSALFTVYPLVAGQNLAAAPRDEPAPEDEEPFRDLFLHDLVVGLVELQRRGPVSQRLTPLQARALLPLRAAIAERLHADLRAADKLDPIVRAKLTEGQMLAIRNLQQGGLRAMPWSLDDYSTAFGDMLEAVAEERPFADPFPHEPSPEAPGAPGNASPAPSPPPGGASPAPSPAPGGASTGASPAPGGASTDASPFAGDASPRSGARTPQP